MSAAAMLSRKRRQNENHYQQHERALPVVRQEARQHCGHLAFLEMLRQQREAEQQAEQVGEDHPLVQHVQPEAAQSRAGLESGKTKFVERDHGQAGERHLQRVVVKKRDASEGEREQRKIDRHAHCDRRGANDQRTRKQPALAREQPHHHAFHAPPD